MKELTEKEAFNKAAALCAGAEHCRSEIANKLAKWHVSPVFIEQILDRLVEERYIDEARYAHFYAHDKLRYNQWGRIKIAQGLRLKQIPREATEAALASLDETEYRSIIIGVLKAKKRTVKGRNDYERTMKLLRYAMGKGFEPAIVQPLIHLDDEAIPLEDDW